MCNAGEMVLIPARWWHQTYALEPSVAVASQHVGRHNAGDMIAHSLDVAARAESAFATVVSPCPAKGLALLRALAARLPRVPFAAVCTGWTNDATRLLLRREGVTLLPAALAVDDFYRRTKVLLVPSVWPKNDCVMPTRKSDSPAIWLQEFRLTDFLS